MGREDEKKYCILEKNMRLVGEEAGQRLSKYLDHLSKTAAESLASLQATMLKQPGSENK